MNSVHLTLNWRRTVREFPFNSSPSKTFWDELKGDQPIIVLHFSVHSPWTSFSYMKSMNNDRLRSMIIAEAMNIDRYDHWSYWFMHECAVHAMKGYWSCMKTVDHSYEQALIMHDNVHIHVIMNIIMTPSKRVIFFQDCSTVLVQSCPVHSKNPLENIWIFFSTKPWPFFGHIFQFLRSE